MCLTVPGRIVRIETAGDAERVARVDFGTTERSANLVFTPDARVGDYVIVQAGFATRRLAEDEAEEALAYHRELDALARGAEPSTAAAER